MGGESARPGNHKACAEPTIARDDASHRCLASRCRRILPTACNFTPGAHARGCARDGARRLLGCLPHAARLCWWMDSEELMVTHAHPTSCRAALCVCLQARSALCHPSYPWLRWDGLPPTDAWDHARGSHSIAYFMQEISSADEAHACPNSHSPQVPKRTGTDNRTSTLHPCSHPHPLLFILHRSPTPLSELVQLLELVGLPLEEDGDVRSRRQLAAPAHVHRSVAIHHWAV